MQIRDAMAKDTPKSQTTENSPVVAYTNAYRGPSWRCDGVEQRRRHEARKLITRLQELRDLGEAPSRRESSSP